MVKKKFKKNVVKTKSLGFKIPESFSGLNFNQKIIAVTLIVLVVGIIGSLFPGDNVTGMATGFQNVFAPLKDALSGANNLIMTVFGKFFPGETIQVTYLIFVLFALATTLVYFVMKLAGSENPFINLIVGIAIAYLSTFFIPVDVILATGVLYSSTFMSIVLLIPFILLWMIFFKLPKTRGGYVLRCILMVLMHILIVRWMDMTSEGISLEAVKEIAGQFYWINVINNIGALTLVVIWAAFFWSLWKAIWRAKTGEAEEEKAVKEYAVAGKQILTQIIERGGKLLVKKGGKP